MTPRPDLSWKSISLDAKIDGPFKKPAVSGALDISALKAAGASVADIAANIQGDSGTARLKAVLAGVRIPGDQPDLLAAAPVQITAEMRLDQATRPIHFSLAHPLITADGEVITAGSPNGKLKLDLPNLAPTAMLAGLDLQGHAVLNLTGAYQNGTTRLNADGALAVTGGRAPVPALIGDEARLRVSAAATGSDVTVSRFEIDGREIKASAVGTVGAKNLALDWQLALSDLTSALPTMAGALQLHGRITRTGRRSCGDRRALGNAWANRQTGGTDQRERAIARPPQQACRLGHGAGRAGRISARAGACGNPRR
jgi:translocation and assembly module TamB